ncbi:MAG: family 1 glycosylhydrolase [Chloroflexota bacterium]
MSSPIEIWGGIECTVNRVADRFFDQLEWSGHAGRIADLQTFAELGLTEIRYPLLWERIAPHGLDQADWSWADERLQQLHRLGLRPIIGLLHHGSGPADTSLVDPAFPEKLATFARAVAERYPWVDAYTPVNEPLTTARFSGLYGLWYPHSRSDGQFVRALLSQVRGVQLAMQAIRTVNPAAQLVQTEDLGKIYSTPTLAYQAGFENTRRWLSLDLLTGRVTPEHRFYGYLQWAGAAEAELAALVDAPCPPDIVGLNYYVTGERFLDERLERYPGLPVGGNGQHSYVDVEAVRVLSGGIAGARGLLAEAWQRYSLPLALTEVHLGATREEQLRWLVETWQAVQAARQDGADVRALTAWALLGSYNWHCLLTRDEQHYESGVFDLRGGEPRPTLLARALHALAHTGRFDHPALDRPGWWRRPERLLYPPVDHPHTGLEPQGEPSAAAAAAASAEPLPATAPLTAATPLPAGTPRQRVAPRRARPAAPRRLLITGATGTLGQAFARLCQARSLPFLLTDRRTLDIRSRQQVDRVLHAERPWAVINAAGYVSVDDAQREPQACFAANTLGPANLAAACAGLDLPLLTFSSDLVFDGQAASPYLEDSQTNPLTVYGQSKAQAETAVLDRLPTALVVRTSAFFSPWDTYNFPRQVIHALQSGCTFEAAEDLTISPTYLPDLVHTCLDLLLDGAAGLWHLANLGAVTWLEFGRQAAAAFGLDPLRVTGCPAAEMGLAAPRPRYSVLGSRRGALLPALEQALAAFAAGVPTT